MPHGGRSLFGSLVPKPIVYTRTPRAAASEAASTGSGPALLAPSVSNTMMAGAYAPCGSWGCASVDGLASG